MSSLGLLEAVSYQGTLFGAIREWERSVAEEAVRLIQGDVDRKYGKDVGLEVEGASITAKKGMRAVSVFSGLRLGASLSKPFVRTLDAEFAVSVRKGGPQSKVVDRVKVGLDDDYRSAARKVAKSLSAAFADAVLDLLG